MECALCKIGMTQPGKTTVTLEKEGTIVVLKDVPAEVCTNCGHYYLSEETSRMVMQKGKEAVDKGAEVEVVKLKVA